MDTAHVSLIILLLRKSGFEHYRCDRNVNLGLSLSSLGKILKAAGPDDILTLQAGEKSDYLTILFEGKNDRMCEYDLKLMNIDADHLGVPEPEYDAIVTMSSAEFKRICTDMKEISDNLTLSIDKEGIKFSVDGDIGTGSVTLKAGSGGSIDEKDEYEDTTTKIEVSKAVSVVLASKYLCNFAKATPLSKQVSLSVSNDIPMLVQYRIGEIGHVRYYLAPKMDDEE
ncbi:proliferating cell nuclear antigen, C-terminal domain-containing protein [Globomyces pollinis-pini]|nr:proliferating cell nuclear antigen, C-terminal domain-containing protein [Globomyces pollinis-pini]